MMTKTKVMPANRTVKAKEKLRIACLPPEDDGHYGFMQCPRRVMVNTPVGLIDGEVYAVEYTSDERPLFSVCLLNDERDCLDDVEGADIIWM